MRRNLTTCLLIAALQVGLRGQGPEASQASDTKPFEFDVVSIKPTSSNRRGGPGPFVNTMPGRLFARGPLLFLIQYAYGLQSFQLVGAPEWASSDRFDIEA
jgi:hypothetical protein